MQNESSIDPKVIEEILKFSKNVIDAPKLVSAPDEINLEVANILLDLSIKKKLLDTFFFQLIWFMVK